MMHGVGQVGWLLVGQIEGHAHLGQLLIRQGVAAGLCCRLHPALDRAGAAYRLLRSCTAGGCSRPAVAWLWCCSSRCTGPGHHTLRGAGCAKGVTLLSRQPVELVSNKGWHATEMSCVQQGTIQSLHAALKLQGTQPSGPSAALLCTYAVMVAAGCLLCGPAAAPGRLHPLCWGCEGRGCCCG